jgi:tetratricopeptide (TPR) repeat protein
MMETRSNQLVTETGSPSTAGSELAPAVAPRRLFLAWLLTAVLVAGTLLLYWPATRYDFVDLDDSDYVFANPHVQAGLSWSNVAWAFATSHAVNWHPLTWLSLMLDADLFGQKAAGFHFTNVVLHSANAGLLFWLLRRLTGATWRSGLVAALFAWHPVHVESVAWVSERKDVLSTFFGFVALLFYERYARKAAGSGKKEERGGGFWFAPSYWLAWLCLALGLMSKPMLVTWPVVFLLLDYWPLGRWKAGREWPLVMEKVPFLLLVLASSVVTFLVQQQGGAVVPMENLPLEMRASNAVISYCRYVGKLVWPAHLAVFYPYPADYWPAHYILLALVFLTSVSAVAFGCRHRQPFLLVGWVWFIVTLVPVIGLVQVGEQALADRYAYIPSVGIFILVIWAAEGLARHGRKLGTLIWVSGSVAVMACLVLTRLQLGYWQSSETLFQHTLAVTKNNSKAHNGLGIVLAREGRTAAALEQYHEALRIQPNFADAHYDLGRTLMLAGQTDAAVSEYQEAVRLKPGYPLAHENLGLIAVQQGRNDDARVHFEEALRLHPDEPIFHNNFGKLLGNEHQMAAAIQQFEEALRLNPKDADACYNLGDVLDQEGQTAAAVKQFQDALRIRPDFATAHYRLGRIFASEGQIDAAIGQFQDVLRLDPDYGAVHDNLGLALASKGWTAAAMSQFQQALQLDPKNAILHDNLGNVLARTGRNDEAMGQFREALRLQPDYAKAHDNLGVELAKEGHNDEAISEFQEAVRLTPDYVKAHDDLGFVLGREKRTDEAIHQYQEALRFNSKDASARTNLVKALALKNQITVPAPKPGGQ